MSPVTWKRSGKRWVWIEMKGRLTGLDPGPVGTDRQTNPHKEEVHGCPQTFAPGLASRKAHCREAYSGPSPARVWPFGDPRYFLGPPHKTVQPTACSRQGLPPGVVELTRPGPLVRVATSGSQWTRGSQWALPCPAAAAVSQKLEEVEPGRG